uniref:5'-3' exonuclease domain-containing protein n=1 Tax=Lactuca sativa TaxID=4236 RepID=A0A9R1XMJ8_LACSA|nr:hypothetical protein LSAT_V11C300147070 [Lactuca sativa]
MKRLRCILGDEADGVPGIQHLVPGFGMKTALKLIKKIHLLLQYLDVNVRIQEEWLHKRHKQNDSEIISSFLDLLGETHCSKALWISVLKGAPWREAY